MNESEGNVHQKPSLVEELELPCSFITVPFDHEIKITQTQPHNKFSRLLNFFLVTFDWTPFGPPPSNLKSRRSVHRMDHFFNVPPPEHCTGTIRLNLTHHSNTIKICIQLLLILTVIVVHIRREDQQHLAQQTNTASESTTMRIILNPNPSNWSSLTALSPTYSAVPCVIRDFSFRLSYVVTHAFWFLKAPPCSAIIQETVLGYEREKQHLIPLGYYPFIADKNHALLTDTY